MSDVTSQALDATWNEKLKKYSFDFLFKFVI